MKKLQEIAAKTHGGKPEEYEVANERVFRKGGGTSMTLAQAAQNAIELGGMYDGHEAPEDINKFTKTSVAALAGQGLMAAAKDKYPHDGQSILLRRELRRSRSGCRNRQVPASWTFSPSPTSAR